MCNFLSGHIVIEEGSKYWGKVLIHTGVHHEVDREYIQKDKRYKDLKLAAWETSMDLKKAKIVHSCGHKLNNEKVLLRLIEKDINDHASVMKRLVKDVDISLSAYWYCKYVKDKKEVRDRITDSYWAYLYCSDVKDRKEVRDHITDSHKAFVYCKYVKDRKEVRDRITDSYWAYLYCSYVKDRKEVRDRIMDGNGAYLYCRDVKDRKEVRDRITDSSRDYWYGSSVNYRK